LFRSDGYFTGPCMYMHKKDVSTTERVAPLELTVLSSRQSAPKGREPCFSEGRPLGSLQRHFDETLDKEALASSCLTCC